MRSIHLLVLKWNKPLCLQIQHSVQGADPEVGPEPLQHHGHHRELDDRPEPLDLPGGRVRGRGHRQAAP